MGVSRAIHSPVLDEKQKRVLKRRIKRIIRDASRFCPSLEERVEGYIHKLFKNACREIDPSLECEFRGIILCDDYGYYDVLHEEYLLKRPGIVEYRVHHQWLCFDAKRGSRVYTHCRKVFIHLVRIGLLYVVLAIESCPSKPKR